MVAGVVLSAVGLYAPLAEFAGAGASVPLLGFGHLLAKGVRTAVAEKGAIGILTGGLTAASAGITASLVCGVVCSLVGKATTRTDVLSALLRHILRPAAGKLGAKRR